MEVFMEILLDVLREFWFLLEEMSIYLLFGFLVAGFLSVWISSEQIERHLGKPGMGPIWKASLFGIPLPLCSCGVIPVGASLRQHGASKGATASFLLSTPQTGVDSILATWSLLGPVFAVFRPLAALVTGVVGGGLIAARDRGESVETTEVEACSDGCGSTPVEGSTLSRALRYGFLTLPRDIARALILGLLIAAVISALLPEDFFGASLGSGPLALIVMMLVGIPIYVCATGSIPLALAMMHLGMSPGAALVFLITGPATNSAAITTIWKILGRSSALIYLATVATLALLSGFTLDFLFSRDWILGNWKPEMAHHSMLPHWASLLGALLLVALLLVALLPRRRTSESDLTRDDFQILKVKGMNCGHCVESVTRALQECVGVESAEVSLEEGLARIRGPVKDFAPLISAVEALGFQASR
jgi:hypothetical protein